MPDLGENVRGWVRLLDGRPVLTWQIMGRRVAWRHEATHVPRGSQVARGEAGPAAMTEPFEYSDQQAITDFQWRVGSALVKDTGQVLVTLAFRFGDPNSGYVQLYFGFTDDAAERLVEEVQALLPG